MPFSAYYCNMEHGQKHNRYKPIGADDITFFRSFMGARASTDPEALARCSVDETEDYVFFPEIVLQPQDAHEVSRILAYCHGNKIAVTTRGGGTGLSGGALPVEGGVCLETSRMNKICAIDKDNFQVTVEPGMITERLQDALAEQGLFYPVDPASKGSCFIGGNVAEGSGGPRAVKYGTVKDYVLNLEIVLADGSILWTGANTLKNATGFNLTQLMVGSEGTLAVVTKIVLRLLPLPLYTRLLLVPFFSLASACEAVNEIFLAGHRPSALELMERDALDLAIAYLGGDAPLALGTGIEAHLLIEVDGMEEEPVEKEMWGISKVLERFQTGDIGVAQSADEKDRLWKLRRSIGSAVKTSSIYKEEDTVVPRSFLPQLVKKVKEIGTIYGFRSVCYGHAGDGNLHVNILKGDMDDTAWKENMKKAIRELFSYVHDIGGTISGEHGIGYVQKEYLDIVFPKRTLLLMRQIKEAFDPFYILNPYKILDVE